MYLSRDLISSALSVYLYLLSAPVLSYPLLSSPHLSLSLSLSIYIYIYIPSEAQMSAESMIQCAHSHGEALTLNHSRP